MSMYRVRHQRKRWRMKWPWKRLFPLRIDERFCSECRQPFHEGPLPDEVTRRHHGNVCAIVYPAGTYRQNERVIRVGRWKAGGKQFYCSEFIPVSDIDDVLSVVDKIKEELSASQKTRATRK